VASNAAKTEAFGRPTPCDLALASSRSPIGGRARSVRPHGAEVQMIDSTGPSGQKKARSDPPPGTARARRSDA